MSNHGNYTDGGLVLIAIQLLYFIKLLFKFRSELLWLLRIKTTSRQGIHVDTRHFKVRKQEMTGFVAVQSYQAVGA